MATSLVDDFDESDEEVVGPVDAKTVADSVDVENLEANLFSSFNSKRRKPSLEKIAAESSSKGIAKQPELGVTRRSSEKPQQSSHERALGSVKKPPTTDIQGRDDDLDDILDLLSSDGETTRTKPKGNRAFSEGDVIGKQGKPITYGEEGKGQQQADKVSNPMAKPKSSGLQITFDNGDDDDILSGMGLGNDKPSIPNTAPSKPSSIAPQYGGGGGAHLAPPTPTGDDVGEEETVQFGGYTPSMGDPSPMSASVARRRKAKSKSLPSAVPPIAKKTVRFSDQPESEQPRSAPHNAAREREKVEGEDKVVPQSVRSSRESGAAAVPTPSSREESSPLPIPPSRDSPSRDSPLQDLPSRDSPSRDLPSRDSPSRDLPSRNSQTSTDEELGDSILLGPSEVSEGRGRSASEGVKLEHPVFPWQKGAGNRTSTVSAGYTAGSRASSSPHVMSAPPHVGVGDAGRAVGRPSGKGEPERRQPVQDLEQALEEGKAECDRLEDILSDSKKQVSEGLERQHNLEEENKQHRAKVTDTEEAKRKMESELRESLEEYKVNLYKVELERTQLQQQLEVAKQRQGEEIEALQKSHDLRLASLEESLARRESRWKEELEVESGRWQEKLLQVERDKTDAVLGMRRKFDSSEVSKTNEISRLQSVHRSSIEDVKREHEMDRQHLIRLHSEEVEALKAAHSHTRMLAELNSKVEASTKDVGHLQAKLSDTHTKLLDERAQRNKTQEEHLRTLEERLVSQQATNEGERERLQSLVAKLESHISQQSKTVEQDRWQLQQQSTRVKVQQASFQEERAAALGRLEEEREQFHTTRERFLTEQQEILTKCYEEQRLVGAEKAQVGMSRKKAEERERRDTQISEQLKEEVAQMSEEKMSLGKQLEELRLGRRALESDREKLEAFASEIEKRSREIDELCKSSLEVGERGERELLEAKKMREDLSTQSECLQIQLTELRDKEQQLAAENLSLAEQRRNGLRETIPSPTLPESLHHQELLSNCGRRQHSVENSSLLSSLPITHPQIPNPLLRQALSSSVGCPPHKGSETYSPRASPAHVSVPNIGVQLRSLSIRPYLTQIDNKKNMREMVAAAERDYEELEKESEFLASLENNHIMSNIRY